MIRRAVLFLMLAGLAILPGPRAAAQVDDPVTLGVLAFGGEDHARARWQATADYLSERLAPRTVRLLPLTLDSTDTALEARELHFLLTNPGHYENLRHRHDLSPLVSLRTDAPGRKKTGNRYGAVIFVRADDERLQRLSDLRGTRFGAVAPEAFGGWQLALHTLMRHGLDPEADFAELRFLGFPQSAIAEAVLRGDIDAGTVRTGVIEAMEADGRVPPGSLRVLNALDVPGFDFLLSTALVPEWLIAATPEARPDLRRDVAVALLEIEPAEDGAQPHGPAWVPPQSQAPVLDILHALAEPAAPDGVPFRPYLAWTFGLLAAVAAVIWWRRSARRLHAADGASPVEAPIVGVEPSGDVPTPVSPPTPREAEILFLIEQGQTSKEIAQTLSISPKTVEFHRHNLLQKFEAANTADLVSRSARWRHQGCPEPQQA